METKHYTPHFLTTVTWLINQIEGDYVNHPNDPGGETRFGISAKTYPQLDIRSLTIDAAIALYWQDFWLPNRCDALPPPWAAFVFDSAVNHRFGVGTRLMQLALGVTADGVIGPQTISAATNSIPRQIVLLEDALSRRGKLYADLTLADSSQAAFLRGWLKRLLQLQRFILLECLYGQAV